MTSNEVPQDTYDKVSKAEEIFRIGPETLIEEASAIVAGPVSNYRREVEETSSPPENIPMRWIVSAQIAQPKVLKGQVPTGGPIQFSRSEQSIVMPQEGSALYWESSYGDVDSKGSVVLFLGENGPQQILKVVPSGKGEKNLIELVKNIVQIQAAKKPEGRLNLWLSYLETSPTTEGRKAALRSATQSSIQWPKLKVVLDHFLRNHRFSNDVRGFAFGIVTFNVIKNRWRSKRDAVVDFLCRTFVEETDPELVLQYMDSLSVILYYCDDEDFVKERRQIRQQVVQILKARKSLTIGGGPTVDPEIEREYQEIRKEYLRQ